MTAQDQHKTTSMRSRLTQSLLRGFGRRPQGAPISAEVPPLPMEPEIAPGEAAIWVHVRDQQRILALCGTLTLIRRERPEVRFLITSNTALDPAIMERRLPAQAAVLPAPVRGAEGMDGFLNRWHPAAILWAEDDLPVRGLAGATAPIPPMFVLASTLPSRSINRLRWSLRLSHDFWDRVSAVFPDSQASVDLFSKARAPHRKILSASPLQLGTVADPYDHQLRSDLARRIEGRPVWFAANIAAQELPLVVAAQKLAARSSHRLLTIIAPGDDLPLPALLANLPDTARVGLRSDPEGLNPLTDILIADVPGELDLLHQSAPVSFLGQSLVPRGGCSPLGAAALGSAVLHGPHVETFADCYLMLAQAGAAVEVASPESLAEAVTELMSPDRAAEMAHAAWAFSSDGAEVTDLLLETLFDHMDRQTGEQP